MSAALAHVCEVVLGDLGSISVPAVPSFSRLQLPFSTQSGLGHLELLWEVLCM